MEAETSAAGAMASGSTIGKQSLHQEQEYRNNDAALGKKHMQAAAAQGKTLSKNELKRMIRAEKREQLKPQRKREEREKRKAKKLEARLDSTARPSKIYIREHEQEPFQANVVIDCGFDELMTEKEIISMTSQFTQLYSKNRKAQRPFDKVIVSGQGQCSAWEYVVDEEQKASVTSDAAKSVPCVPIPPTMRGGTPLLEGRIGQRMEQQMRGTWHRWARFHLHNFGGLETLDKSACARQVADDFCRDADVLLCDKDSMVYLTADTDDELVTLEQGTTYIIGGIVDRNRYKYICATKAKALGIRTARLPIPDKYLKTSSVMTIDQVFAILLTYNQTQDWPTALERCLPRRKRADIQAVGRNGPDALYTDEQQDGGPKSCSEQGIQDEDDAGSLYNLSDDAADYEQDGSAAYIDEEDEDALYNLQMG